MPHLSPVAQLQAPLEIKGRRPVPPKPPGEGGCTLVRGDPREARRRGKIAGRVAKEMRGAALRAVCPRNRPEDSVATEGGNR